MICVMNVVNGVVHRVGNEIAHRMVKEGVGAQKFQYCSKTVWKGFKRAMSSEAKKVKVENEENGERIRQPIHSRQKAGDRHPRSYMQGRKSSAVSHHARAPRSKGNPGVGAS